MKCPSHRRNKLVKTLISQGTLIGKIIQCQSVLWNSDYSEMRSGEAKLLMAIITKAFEDLPLLLYKRKEFKTKEQYYQIIYWGNDARRFIFGKGLLFYTSLLQLDPDWIRMKIKEWMRIWKELKKKR
jgi:hypothetical protein